MAGAPVAQPQRGQELRVKPRWIPHGLRGEHSIGPADAKEEVSVMVR
jgi:hypothetical protein